MRWISTMRAQEKEKQALNTVSRRTNVGLLLIFVTRIKTGHFVVDFLKHMVSSASVYNLTKPLTAIPFSRMAS